VAKAHTALLIANHNQCGKSKSTTAFHNFSDPIDVNQAIHHLRVAAVVLIAITPSPTALSFFRHPMSLLTRFFYAVFRPLAAAG
jgi:hypothetical protein